MYIKCTCERKISERKWFFSFQARAMTSIMTSREQVSKVEEAWQFANNFRLKTWEWKKFILSGVTRLGYKVHTFWCRFLIAWGLKVVQNHELMMVRKLLERKLTWTYWESSCYALSRLGTRRRWTSVGCQVVEEAGELGRRTWRRDLESRAKCEGYPAAVSAHSKQVN